ncbi:hypothetical protein BC834DRAFT_1030808 [Gloeopeniophorella convolvens]|nr:hypothetical protein BC834DRAFT_1030808 [Gloeopeniophorella convolvens]
MSTPSVPPSEGEQVHEQVLDPSQQQQSPVHPTLTVVRVDGVPHLKTLYRKEERKYYVTATDGLRVERTSAIRSRGQSVQWDEILSGLTVKPSSRLIMRVFAQRTRLRDVHIGLLAIPFESIRSSPFQEFDISFDPTLKTTLVLSMALPEASQHATSVVISSPEALWAPSVLGSADLPAGPSTSSDGPDPADPLQVADRSLVRAEKAATGLGGAQGLPLELLNAVDEAPDQLEKVADLYDTWKVALGNVKLVVDVVDKIAEIHPWAKMAWSILSCIPKTLIAQVERDDSFKALLIAIRDAFDLAKQAKELENLLPGSSQVKILKEMLRHVGACGDLIQNYAKGTTFRQSESSLHPDPASNASASSEGKRLVENIGSDASDQVKHYSEMLTKLRGDFLDHAAISTQMSVAALSDDVAALSGRLEGLAVAQSL